MNADHLPRARAPAWVSVDTDVPHNRREVYVYGHRTFPPMVDRKARARGRPLGVSRWNGTAFEIELHDGGLLRPRYKVTHWADIVPPGGVEPMSPDDDEDLNPAPAIVDRAVVDDCRRLQLKAGDVLVLSTPERISDDQRERIKTWAEGLFPGHSIIVMDSGYSIGAIGYHDPEAKTLSETFSDAMLEALRRHEGRNVSEEAQP